MRTAATIRSAAAMNATRWVNNGFLLVTSSMGSTVGRINTRFTLVATVRPTQQSSENIDAADSRRPPQLVVVRTPLFCDGPSFQLPPVLDAFRKSPAGC